MSSEQQPRKPKVLALSYPAYTNKAYLEDFTSKFELHVLKSTDRAGAIPEIAQLAASCGPFDAVMVRIGIMPFKPFDAELFGPLLPHLKIVAAAPAGFNAFDVDWMTKNNIWFCNTRNAISEATADMAMFLILATLKNTTVAERSAREGRWRDLVVNPSTDPRGLTLGIVGMGSIGKLLAKKALAFNLKIRYYSRKRLSLDIEEQYNASYCPTLDDLLSTSDIVSINCPLNDATTGLIGRREFAKMKDGAYFVNTARGEVVDEGALIEALESGKVKMAGLDVFEGEPTINEYFRTSEKCIIQPHLGGNTTGAWMLSELECLENIKACLTTGVPVAPVNWVERRS
ncbi:hypothetical protein D8B26_007640 [Coccidioides posadasii str. Silveira]|uniref:Uncharacterized protein n=2 Tax=Coccidioides posadasii TaxID=199306 RepID=E9D2J5_COCPS|nr:conserved hypothetical protein [Coccidioides posadasii str. Silveira]KMM71868.1 D-specific alpha-keto acid dehydrogenase [Coccidioides posadasii RMSCC 3488]QVM13024.1 hypothetical protein D8B26_007640 [Coccidioides posadasii str. Silveira]